MQFEFATAARIIFGPGKLNVIGGLVEGLSNRALIVSGVPEEISGRVRDQLDSHSVISEIVQITGEPTVDTVRQIVDVSKIKHSEIIVGIGGGSAIDTAKAVAALSTNPGDITDYLEGIGLNKSLEIPSLPVIAIPSTAGTGSEVTRNAVIGSPTHQVKVSLRSPYLLPKIALVDPELTLSIPPEITAFTGLDALTQLIEPFTCNTPNPLTDAVCVEGIHYVARSLVRVYDDGKNLQAREEMSLASLFSGIALANSKLGAVHGLAGAIGGEIPAHHGAICACLLPYVIEANIAALVKHSSTHPTLERYAIVGRLLSGRQDATPETVTQWIKDTCHHLKIQSLSTLGLLPAQFSSVIEKAFKSSSMKGNPITLSEDELRNILQKASLS